MLQVAVHDHDLVASGRFQARRERRLLAKIARELDDAQLRHLPAQRLQCFH